MTTSPESTLVTHLADLQRRPIPPVTRARLAQALLDWFTAGWSAAATPAADTYRQYFFKLAHVYSSMELGTDCWKSLVHKTKFEAGVVHSGFKIRLQISGIGKFNKGATVGHNGYLPAVAGFDFPDVSILEKGFLHDGHVDFLLA